MKNWYKSKTVWFNIILVLLGALNDIAQFIPMPHGLLEGVGIIGTILRTITTQPLLPPSSNKPNLPSNG